MSFSNIEIDKDKRIIRRSVWTKDYLMEKDMVFFTINEHPITYEEVVFSDEYAGKWRGVMNKELEILKDHNTYCEVQKAVGKKVIEGKWVLKKKIEMKFKTRLKLLHVVFNKIATMSNMIYMLQWPS